MDYSLINKKKILITGANSRFAKSLKQFLFGKNIFYTDRKKLDILDVKSIENCLNKYEPDYIIHLAASFDHSDKNKKSTIETSKIGSENLIKIAKKIKFKKIIYTSSVAVCGVNKSAKLMNEYSNNIKDADLSDPYINAKVISHNLIYDAMTKDNLPILILMPSAIIGARDYKKTPSNLLINKLMAYPLNKFYINAGLNVINVKDVANAHCIGLLNSIISDTYIVSGYNVTIKDLVTLVNKTQSIECKLFLLPKNFILIISMILLPFAKIFRVHLPISFFQINNRLNTFGFFDNAKFINDWGVKLKPLESTILETISWLEKRT